MFLFWKTFQFRIEVMRFPHTDKQPYQAHCTGFINLQQSLIMSFPTELKERSLSLVSWLILVPVIQVNICKHVYKENSLKFRDQLEVNLRDLRVAKTMQWRCCWTPETNSLKQNTQEVISKAKSLPVKHLNSNPMWSQTAISFDRI